MVPIFWNIDQNDRIDDPRHPTYDPLITPHHIIYLMGSNFLVIHRFKLMMEQKGINLDEIGDYDEIEGLTLDLEEEVYKRKSMKRRDQGGKYEEYKVGLYIVLSPAIFRRYIGGSSKI